MTIQLVLEPEDGNLTVLRSNQPMTMAMGIKFVVVWEIQGDRWACFRGLSFLSDEQVLLSGELVSETLARELFPEILKLKTIYGGIRFNKGGL
jgi:hypothetical protein